MESQSHKDDDDRKSLTNRISSFSTHACRTVFCHARSHTGVGLVCSVAYFDPGNWGVDLQAGSESGYRLLFVVLLSGIFAVFLQVLASRLGCVTGLDLATHCRLLFHDRPKHTRLYRWAVLYPLYLLAEVAIIATDLAELLGSAIALVLLFPGLKLWQGVLITSADVIILLAIRDPLRGTPVRMFEFLIAVLVVAVLICVSVVISKVNVNWAQAFLGFVPSKYIFKADALYTSVGIIGATVMPHSIFLGSALATQDRIDYHGTARKERRIEAFTSSTTPTPARYRNALVNYVKTSFWNAVRIPRESEYSKTAKRHSEHENNHLGFVLAHVHHGVADVVICLLGFAVVINALILILAGAVFYYGSDEAKQTGGPASLFDAYNLINKFIGKGAATLFAVALLASGQSSSLIATIAGQAVAEGFIQWRLSPVLRRLLTRLIAIVPSMTVAIVVGPQGINTLLVASQVVLSMALPFITLPLIYLTSSKKIMSVRKRHETLTTVSLQEEATSPAEHSTVGPIRVTDPELDTAADEWVDFSNGKIAIVIGVLIWLLIVAANVYVLVKL